MSIAGVALNVVVYVYFQLEVVESGIRVIRVSLNLPLYDFDEHRYLTSTFLFVYYRIRAVVYA